METVLTALAPVVVTLLLGFVAAWHRDFAAKDAAVLNRMVVLYAMPVALFVGTVGTPRSELVQHVAFAVAMCVIACRMADSASGWSWTMPTNFAGVFLM